MLQVFTFLLLIATLIIQATCAQSTPPKDELQCLNQHNVTKEEMANLFEEVKKGNEAVDRKLKCFIKCVTDVHGITNENGKIDIEQLLGKPEDQIAIKIGNDCKAKYDSENDECEYMFKILVCVTVNVTEHLEKRKSTLY